MGRAVRWNGAGSRIRTRDPLITNQVLYQLSYAGASESGLSRKAGGDASVLGVVLVTQLCLAGVINCAISFPQGKRRMVRWYHWQGSSP